MAGTIVAVFSDNKQAEQAAKALVEDGVSLADITLVFEGAGGETGAPHDQAAADNDTLARGVREVETHDVERPINAVDEVGPRALVGFVIGAPIASLGVALLVFFPFAADMLATHSLPAQLGGGLLGGIIGALIGGASSGGIPPKVAGIYHAHIKRGDTLVTALSSSRNAPHLQEILKAQGGHHLGFFPRFLDSIQSLES